jgi:hypothetical protein
MHWYQDTHPNWPNSTILFHSRVYSLWLYSYLVNHAHNAETVFDSTICRCTFIRFAFQHTPALQSPKLKITCKAHGKSKPWIGKMECVWCCQFSSCFHFRSQRNDIDGWWHWTVYFCLPSFELSSVTHKKISRWSERINLFYSLYNLARKKTPILSRKKLFFFLTTCQISM